MATKTVRNEKKLQCIVIKYGHENNKKWKELFFCYSRALNDFF